MEVGPFGRILNRLRRKNPMDFNSRVQEKANKNVKMKNVLFLDLTLI
jgi:hypothetical protein